MRGGDDSRRTGWAAPRSGPGTAFPNTRATACRLAQEGWIRVDGASPDARRKVWGGECVEIDAPPPPRSPPRCRGHPAAVVHEDEDLLVIDKPVGLVVHPGKLERDPAQRLVAPQPRARRVPRAGISTGSTKGHQRADGGSEDAARRPSSCVSSRRARSARHYRALVQGALTAGGTVDAPIGRHPTQRTRMAVVGNGRPAVTHYRVTERFPRATLVECRLETRANPPDPRPHGARRPCAGRRSVYGARRWLR